jgi:hypothetical protein
MPRQQRSRMLNLTAAVSTALLVLIAIVLLAASTYSQRSAATVPDDASAPVEKISSLRVMTVDNAQDQEGVQPAVAITNDGRIVEVHRSDEGADLWYSVATTSDDGLSVSWTSNSRLNIDGSTIRGMTPDVCTMQIDLDGPPYKEHAVILVYRSKADSTIHYCYGVLESDNSISWERDAQVVPSFSNYGNVNALDGLRPRVAADTRGYAHYEGNTEYCSGKIAMACQKEDPENDRYDLLLLPGVINPYEDKVDWQSATIPSTAGFGSSSDADISVWDNSVIVAGSRDEELYYYTGKFQWLPNTWVIDLDLDGSNDPSRDIGDQTGDSVGVTFVGENKVMTIHHQGRTTWCNFGDVQGSSVEWNASCRWDDGITPNIAYDPTTNLVVAIRDYYWRSWGIFHHHELWLNIGKVR